MRGRRKGDKAVRNLNGLIGLVTLLVVPDAQARITRIEISRVESPTFEGTSFGDVGPYQKLASPHISQS